MNQRELSELRKLIDGLEQNLCIYSQELAELTYLMKPYLVRYQQEVLLFHEQLSKVQRDIADAKVLLGDDIAKEPALANTPLSRLVDTPDFRPVQEQYDRVWHGKKPPTLDEVLGELPEAGKDILDLYAYITINIYPDFAKTPEEYTRRRVLMHKVNQALVHRDEFSLQGIADVYRDHTNLPAVVDSDEAEKLTLRKLLLESAIVRLEGQIFELRHGDISKIIIFAEQARAEERDLLMELSESIQRDIYFAKRELEKLNEQM